VAQVSTLSHHNFLSAAHAQNLAADRRLSGHAPPPAPAGKTPTGLDQNLANLIAPQITPPKK